MKSESNRAPKWRKLALSASALALAAASPAWAQADAAGAQSPPATNEDDTPQAERTQVGDIIVTAQRRAERDIEVPASLTTLDSDEIENITASFLTDVGSKIPNVQFTPGTNSPAIAIRGVSSQSNINAGFPPAVGVYIDEVYQGRDPTFNSILNDVERVEVLRGPQGTLYGKNTIGGAINIVTRDPTNDAFISGDISYGNYEFLKMRASAGGALVPDQLMVRVSAVHRQRDGFVLNTVNNQRLNDLNSDGGRIVLLSNISENVRLRISADYFTEDGTTVLETGPATLAALPIFASIPAQVATDNIVQLNASEFAERELWGVAGRLDIDFDFATLTSITALRGYRSDFNDDSDGLPVDAFEVGRQENGDNFSQEIRLASNGDNRLNWILGFYYYDEDTENFRRIRLGSAMPFLLVGALTPVVFPNYTGEAARTESRIQSTSYAFFGSATFDVTDRLSVSAGLRYTHEEKDFRYRQFYTQTYSGGIGGSIIPNFAVNIPQRSETYSEGQLTGDASVSYAFTPDHIAYFRYSRGFKAGGFQTDVISPPFNATERLGFDPEFVDSYEVGFKTYLFNRRLRLNLAAFYMDWEDKQEQVFTGLSFLIRNAATARSQGLELELTATPLPGLSLDANLGYLDTRYVSFPGNALEGRNFPNLPEWTGSAGAQYVFPIFGNVDAYLRGDVNHRGDTYNLPNATTIVVNNALTTLNARIGIQDHGGRWGLYLWGRNLTDARRLGVGSNFPFPNANITTRSPGFGDTYGVELRFNF